MGVAVKEPNTREVEVTIVGIAVWVIAFVLLATVFRHDLQRHHTTWWLWTCPCGIVLGLYGLRAALRRRRTVN
jgi:membrane protein DedA with SNARE-associated domain